MSQYNNWHSLCPQIKSAYTQSQNKTKKNQNQAAFIHAECKLKDLYSSFGLVFMLLKTGLNSEWL